MYRPSPTTLRSEYQKIRYPLNSVRLAYIASYQGMSRATHAFLHKLQVVLSICAPGSATRTSHGHRLPHSGTGISASISSVMYRPSPKILRSEYQKIRSPFSSVKLAYIESHQR